MNLGAQFMCKWKPFCLLSLNQSWLSSLILPGQQEIPTTRFTLKPQALMRTLDAQEGPLASDQSRAQQSSLLCLGCARKFLTQGRATWKHASASVQPVASELLPKRQILDKVWLPTYITTFPRRPSHRGPQTAPTEYCVWARDRLSVVGCGSMHRSSALFLTTISTYPLQLFKRLEKFWKMCLGDIISLSLGFASLWTLLTWQIPCPFSKRFSLSSFIKPGLLLWHCLQRMLSPFSFYFLKKQKQSNKQSTHSKGIQSSALVEMEKWKNRRSLINY